MKKWHLVAVVGLVIVFVAVSSLLSVIRRQTKTKAPPPETAVFGWMGVQPGQTSKDELIKQAGRPASQSASIDGSTMQYPSNNQYWFHEVSLRGERVSFVRERVFAPSDRSLSARVNKINRTPTVLYGPDSKDGMFLYLFADVGVALLGSEEKDVVYEIWHFPPTNTNEFLRLPEARSYSLSPRLGPDI